MIPYAAVPKEDPPFTVWYASWSTVRPSIEEGMNHPMVIGFAEVGRVPEGATILGAATTKTPPLPPPPPPALADNLGSYQLTFADWMARRRG